MFKLASACAVNAGHVLSIMLQGMLAIYILLLRHVLLPCLLAVLKSFSECYNFGGVVCTAVTLCTAQ